MRNKIRFIAKVMATLGFIGMFSAASESDMNPSMPFTSILIKLALSFVLLITGYFVNEFMKKENEK